MEPVEFRVLGSLQVMRQDTAVDVGSPVQRMLLAVLVDNCEHVIAEVSRILDVLAVRCPRVVLATSRVALELRIGQSRTVEPLPVAPADADADDESSPAVQLFMDRARAVRPDLELEPADRARVVEVCRRLDGLPLAIELAAARIRSLNVADVAERLDDRFRLLSDRRTPARHQTLRAVVDWSFELLSETERQLFERLSVFVGAFTPAAAERVCAGSPVEADEVLDLLARLVDASMVTIGPAQGETTYRLLETLRTYGRARLADSGDLEWFEEPTPATTSTWPRRPKAVCAARTRPPGSVASTGTSRTCVPRMTGRSPTPTSISRYACRPGCSATP